MKSQLLIILGISSTLLGLYILVISLLNYQERADYHIGTYLSDHSIDNSFKFRTRLNQLKARGDQSRNFDEKVRGSQLVDPQLHHKSIDLTKNVENYIQKLTLVKKYQEGNMQFFTELSKARQNYESCANELKSDINIDESRQLWTVYKTCFDQYQDIKENVQGLYSKRNKYLEEIDRLLVFDPNTNPDFDFQAEIKKIRQRYDRQNAQNDRNKVSFIAELKRLQSRNQTKSSEYDQSERQFDRLKIQYDLCLKNLKQFRKCEDIANALREYGYVESVQSLEDRIRSKRQMLMKLRELVLQSRQDGGNNTAMTQMFEKRQKQLIQIIKLRLYMGYDEMKQCGCTQEQRKKLEREFQAAKMKLNQNKKQINDLMYEIFIVERKIKETDQIRQKLINQYTEETERLRNRQNSHIMSLKEILELLRGNLTNVNRQINEQQPKFHSLEFQCNQYKDRLALKLNDSERVADCFAKKNFYDQLKSKAQIILRRDDESSLVSKQNLKRSLQSIHYPENNNLKQIHFIDEDIQKLQHTAEPITTQILEQTQPRQVVQIQNEVQTEKPEQVQVVVRVEQKVTIETKEL